jgi:two-component system, OmpR family, alkaline phosphatase synthesis response regulator PhoP
LEVKEIMSKRIILCDDEIHILRAAEFKLKRAGYDVELSNDGEEGWEAIQRQIPDILITDCQMPRLSGIELVRRMRNDPKTADIPVFMLTAKGYELSPQLIHDELRIIRIISKPFSPRELLQYVDSLLTKETADVV